VVFINIANFKDISHEVDVFEVLKVLTQYFEVGGWSTWRVVGTSVWACLCRPCSWLRCSARC
jgi:hypothetical protein